MQHIAADLNHLIFLETVLLFSEENALIVKVCSVLRRNMFYSFPVKDMCKIIPVLRGLYSSEETSHIRGIHGTFPEFHIVSHVFLAIRLSFTAEMSDGRVATVFLYLFIHIFRQKTVVAVIFYHPPRSRQKHCTAMTENIYDILIMLLPFF